MPEGLRSEELMLGGQLVPPKIRAVRNCDRPVRRHDIVELAYEHSRTRYAQGIPDVEIIAIHIETQQVDLRGNVELGQHCVDVVPIEPARLECRRKRSRRRMAA